MGVALGIMAAVYQMYSSFKASKDARRAADEQARIEKERSMYTAADIYREGYLAAGETRAESMASGFEFAGSPYVRAMKTLERAEQDAERVVRFGSTAASFISLRGRAQADAYKNQATAYGVGAVAQAVGGIADYKNKQDQIDALTNGSAANG